MARLLRSIFVLLAVFVVPVSLHAQALPAIDPGRVGSVIQFALKTTLIRRGFAANDPLYISTVSRISSAVSAAAAHAPLVTAGAITAPAWGSIAIGLGIGVMAGFVVDLAIDGLVRWAFNADGTITQTVIPFPVGKAPGWYVPYNGELEDPPADSGKRYGYPTRRPTLEELLKPWEWLTPDMLDRPDLIGYLRATEGYITYSPAEGWLVDEWARGIRSGALTNCYGDAIASGELCVEFSPFAPSDIRTVDHADIGHAISAIPDSELSRPLSPDLLAELANRAWREASSYPDYDGVPFLASDPLTGRDVQASLETSPGLYYPSVGDFVNPDVVSDTFPMPAPDPLPNPGGKPGAIPDPGTQPEGGLQDVTYEDDEPADDPEEESDDGDEVAESVPDIPEPELEQIPTAAEILHPLRQLFPTLSGLNISAQAGECPRPSFDFGGHQFVLRAHCDLIEETHEAITLSCLATFALASLVIVLRA